MIFIFTNAPKNENIVSMANMYPVTCYETPIFSATTGKKGAITEFPALIIKVPKNIKINILSIYIFYI